MTSVALDHAVARTTRGDLDGGPVFDHAVCIADATPGGHTALRQAAVLTRGGSVRSVAAPWRAPSTVWELADGADLPSPAPSRDLRRSVAAGRRIVLDATGVWPEVLADGPIPEPEIPDAVRAFEPTLVVLPLGDAPEARAAAVTIARRVSCPVLAVPP